MADLNPSTDRQKAVDHYLRAANIGTISLVVFSILDFYETTFGLEEFGATMALATLAVVAAFVWAMVHLFRHRNADEFTHALWSAGTTSAFIMLIFWALFGNIFAGILWAFTGDLTAEQPPEMQFVDYWTAPICIAAFFCAFQYKRFKGAY